MKVMKFALQLVFWLGCLHLNLSTSSAFENVSGLVDSSIQPWGGVGEGKVDSADVPSFAISVTSTASSLDGNASGRAYASSSAFVGQNHAGGSVSVSLGGSGNGNFSGDAHASVLCQTCLGGRLTQNLSSTGDGALWSILPTNGPPIEENVFANTSRVIYAYTQNRSHVNPQLFGTSSLTNNWTFQEEDPNKIVKGATLPNGTYVRSLKRRNVFKDGKIDNSKMVMDFSPMNSFGEPIKLACLARELGFDHFNWMQTISVPNGTTLYQTKQILTSAGKVEYVPIKAESGPALDPIVQNPSDNIHVLAGKSLVKVNGVEALRDWDVALLQDANGPFFDDKKPYWSEFNTLEIPDGNKEWFKHELNNHTVLEFIDRPILPDYALDYGKKFWEFTTELVGVKADGTIQRINGGDGLRFRWKSNARFDANLVDSGSIQGFGFSATTADDLELSGGDIFDFEFLAVPEPTSILLLFAMAFCGSTARVSRVVFNL